MPQWRQTAAVVSDSVRNHVTDWKKLLHAGIALAAEGKPAEGLQMLEEGLRTALEDNDPRRILHFSRNAGVVCEQLGDLDAAERYYQLARERDESDAGIHYLLSEVYETTGRRDLARRSLETACRLAAERGDSDLAEVWKKKLGD